VILVQNAAGAPDEHSASANRKGRSQLLPWLLLIGFTVLYLALANGRVTSGDGAAMLAVTESLVERGRFDIPANLVPPARNVNPYSTDLKIDYGEFGPDGCYYAKYGLGLSLAAAPLYAVGAAARALGGSPYAPVFAATMLNALVTAATVALLYLMGRELGWGQRGSLGLSIAFGIASPALVYAKSTFSEPLVTLCLVASALGLLRARRSRSSWGFLVTGAGLGAAVLTRPTALIIVPLFLAYAAWGTRVDDPGRRARAAVALLVPLAMGVIATLLYNQLRFGSLLDLGYRTNNWQTPILRGLYGLVLSPGKGLVWYIPPVLAACFAWPRFVQAHRREALLFAAIVFVTILFHAPYTYWEGGWCWGPRLILPAIPFALAPLAELLDRPSRARLPSMGLAFALTLGLVVQVPAVLVEPSRSLTGLLNDSFDTFFARATWHPESSPIVTQWESVREVTMIASLPELDAKIRGVLASKELALESPADRLGFLSLNVFDFWWVYLRWL
jgi:hypothetical protein